jgi:hypothetical protein
MIFKDQVVSELTAPNTLPFEPGYDIVGIGTEVPPELIAAGYTASIIFYTSSWSAAATTPRVKFFFLGVKPGIFTTGYGYSLNPSTTPTATVIEGNEFTLNAVSFPGFAVTDQRWVKATNNNIFARILELPTSAGGGGALTLYDGTAAAFAAFEVDVVSTGANIFVQNTVTGAVQLAYNSATQTLLFGSANALGYGLWTACTYANGWSAKAAPGFGQRSGVGVIRLPDGTVHLSGVANRGTSAPGTYCVQLPSSAYWPNYGTTFTCFQEAAPDYISMTLDATNGSITIAGTVAAAGAVHFEHSWVVPL